MNGSDEADVCPGGRTGRREGSENKCKLKTVLENKTVRGDRQIFVGKVAVFSHVLSKTQLPSSLPSEGAHVNRRRLAGFKRCCDSERVAWPLSRWYLHSLMCGMEREHMAATRLGSLTQVYESTRNQTRKRMPSGSLASVRCACVFL